LVENLAENKHSGNFDLHWYRRMWHTFGAVFVYYYLVPDVWYLNLAKRDVGICLIILIAILEILRIKGVIGSSLFFGLKLRERKRMCSYVFFAIGCLTLLTFVPEAITVPCLLAACLGDPLMGEVRRKYGDAKARFVGFFFILWLFMIIWYRGPLPIALGISVLGAGIAVAAEGHKAWWFDDDLFMQLLPACTIIFVCAVFGETFIPLLESLVLPVPPPPQWLLGGG
jgi:hypothetical protein